MKPGPRPKAVVAAVAVASVAIVAVVAAAAEAVVVATAAAAAVVVAADAGATKQPINQVLRAPSNRSPLF